MCSSDLALALGTTAIGFSTSGKTLDEGGAEQVRRDLEGTQQPEATLTEGAAPLVTPPVEAVADVRPDTPAQPVKTIYRVKRGDTLASIARNFGTSVSAIRDWNKIGGSKILVGDRLTIYASER